MIEIRVYVLSIAGRIPIELYWGLLVLLVVGLLVLVLWKGFWQVLRYEPVLLLAEGVFLVLCALFSFVKLVLREGII